LELFSHRIKAEADEGWLVTDRFNANAFAWGQSDTTVNEGKKPMELA